MIKLEKEKHHSLEIISVHHSILNDLLKITILKI